MTVRPPPTDHLPSSAMQSVPAWVQYVAALAALLAAVLISYDMFWRRRPRPRVRLYRDPATSRVELIILNRGGEAFTVVRMVFEVLEDGRAPKVKLDQSHGDDTPFVVPAYGAHVVRGKLPADVGGSFMIESIPQGERYFAYPPAFWQGRGRSRLRKTRDWLLRIPEADVASSRDLRGYPRPPREGETVRLR